MRVQKEMIENMIVEARVNQGKYKVRQGQGQGQGDKNSNRDERVRDYRTSLSQEEL